MGTLLSVITIAASFVIVVVDPTSMLVFWGLVIWGVVTVARSANQPARHTLDTPPRDPEQILRERFAQGEIDETEYEHRRQVLRR